MKQTIFMTEHDKDNFDDNPQLVAEIAREAFAKAAREAARFGYASYRDENNVLHVRMDGQPARTVQLNWKKVDRTKTYKLQNPNCVSEQSVFEKSSQNLTTLTEREGDGFVSRCPELDIASQGDTVEEAEANLHEAVELFNECADSRETERRLKRVNGVLVFMGKSDAPPEVFLNAIEKDREERMNHILTGWKP